MRIGILGSGPVGQSLGRGLASRGHDVKIGSRTPKKPELQEWLKATKGRASVGTFAEAAQHGEILALCCLGTAVDSALELAGPHNVEGKVLIDVTVPLDFSKGMPPGLFVGTTDSLGERIQRKLPRAKVVKAFNIVGNPTMVHPQMEEGLPTMLIAGDDAGAKEQVGTLLRELGWEDPIDLGGIEGARWLEAFVPLWVRVAQQVGSWTVAFRVLKK
jgi:predicted dinucleotide-binding enzyme